MIEHIKNTTRAALMLGLLSLIPLESESQTNTVESRPPTMAERVNEAATLSRNINGILTHFGKESFTYTDPVTHASVTFSLKNVPSDSIKEEHLVRSTPSSTLAFTAQAGAGLFKEVTIVSKKNTVTPETNRIRVNTAYHEIITSEDDKKYSAQENRMLIEGYSARFIKEYQAMLNAIEDSTHTTEEQAATYAQTVESHMTPPAQRHETAAFVAGTLGEAASKLIQVLGGGEHEIDRTIIADDGTMVRIRYATGAHPMFMISEEVPGGRGSLAYEFDPKSYAMVSFANLNTGGTLDGVLRIFPTANRVSGHDMLDLSSGAKVIENVAEVEKVTVRAKLLLEKMVTKLIKQ